jgi:hypothetical protein
MIIFAAANAQNINLSGKTPKHNAKIHVPDYHIKHYSQILSKL